MMGDFIYLRRVSPDCCGEVQAGIKFHKVQRVVVGGLELFEVLPGRKFNFLVDHN